MTDYGQSVENHRTNGVHVLAQPPQSHDNTKHSVKMLSAKVNIYTGNGAQNRNVAHGCGVIPVMVIVTSNTTRKRTIWIQGQTLSAIHLDNVGGSSSNGIVSVDATNIVVGNDAVGSEYNVNLQAFEWIAIYEG